MEIAVDYNVARQTVGRMLADADVETRRERRRAAIDVGWLRGPSRSAQPKVRHVRRKDLSELNAERLRHRQQRANRRVRRRPGL